MGRYVTFPSISIKKSSWPIFFFLQKYGSTPLHNNCLFILLGCFDRSFLWFICMKLCFLFGVDGNKACHRPFWFSFSHLLSTSITQKRGKAIWMVSPSGLCDNSNWIIYFFLLVLRYILLLQLSSIVLHFVTISTWCPTEQIQILLETLILQQVVAVFDFH